MFNQNVQAESYFIPSFIVCKQRRHSTFKLLASDRLEQTVVNGWSVNKSSAWIADVKTYTSRHSYLPDDTPALGTLWMDAMDEWGWKEEIIRRWTDTIKEAASFAAASSSSMSHKRSSVVSSLISVDRCIWFHLEDSSTKLVISLRRGQCVTDRSSGRSAIFDVVKMFWVETVTGQDRINRQTTT